MSLSVERVRHMLDVAKRTRGELWDDMDDVGKALSDDCLSAFEELVALKEAKPVAWLVHAEYPYPLPDGPIEGGLPRSPLIIKPE